MSFCSAPAKQAQEAGGGRLFSAEIRHMNDYERVAQIIRHLDAHHVEQPRLDELAHHAGLSPFHFHRLFTRWAGVTPKDFVQCLTAEFARDQLRRGETVLDAALNSGLSSPGRLHDLCITLEAATPGEIKNGGAGWTIDAGFASTPFGICCVGNGPRGVCHMAFVDNHDRTSSAGAIHDLWPQAELSWSDSAAQRIADQVFQNREGGTLRAIVRATPFQIRVWRALIKVPVGNVVSYGHLAKAAGAPGAARAVGTAVGSNPLAFLIPCHRVIRETGVIGQYRWGHERKRIMLGWECTRSGA